MSNLEQQLQELIPSIFVSSKHVPAKDFWEVIEVSIKPEKVDYKVYHAVIHLFEQGVLGLSDGCYYLKHKQEANHTR